MNRNDVRPVRQDKRISVLNEGLSKLYEDYEEITDFEAAYDKICDIFAGKYENAKGEVELEYSDLGADCGWDELTNGGMSYRTEYAEAPNYARHSWTRNSWVYDCDDWFDVLYDYIKERCADAQDWKNLSPAEIVKDFNADDFYEYLCDFHRDDAVEDAQENAEEPEDDYEPEYEPDYDY